MNIELDDGYQFGMGAFETICLKEGKPILLDWHLQRLNKALKFFGIKKELSEDDVLGWLETQLFVKKIRIPDLHAMKIIASSKNTIFKFRNNPYSENDYKKGFKLSYSNILRNETSPLVYHKTINFGDNILAKKLVDDDSDEVIFLNTKGEICEGSLSNIFFVKESQIYTPKLSCGLLPGIVRRFLMTYLPVKEISIYPKDIYQMDECFITNSLMGIMPVTSFENKRYFNNDITKKCMKIYYDYNFK